MSIYVHILNIVSESEYYILCRVKCLDMVHYKAWCLSYTDTQSYHQIFVKEWTILDETSTLQHNYSQPAIHT